MARDAGYFDIGDVAENQNAKLVRRHPHIFGDAVAATPDAVLRNWEQIKVKEKKSKAGGEAGRAMPATREAHKLGSKAAKVGLDWPDAEGLFAKLDEEIAELRVEVDAGDQD